MKKSLVVAVACAFALGTTALLPADLSPIGSVYAKGNGGGGGGGNGGGNGGGHGGGNAGGNGGSHGGGKGDAGGNHGSNSNGNDGGEHAGKATRDHGLSGNHYGSQKNDSKGHGQTTSSVAHSKDTRGLSKATAISGTTPGTHNTKGLSNAGDNSTKHDD